MIKPPKIREQMVRLKTRQFTIRFWFSRRIGPQGIDALATLREDLNASVFDDDTDAIADFIRDKLPTGMPVAAMEILLNSNHSGTVDYFEWP